MAGALSAIAASLHPAKWVKTTSASDNVLNFQRWITEYERWESICTGGLGHNITQRWNLLLSVGGQQLEDIILHQANIIITDVPRQDPVQGRPEQQEMRDANNQIIQQYQAEVREVIGKNGDHVGGRNSGHQDGNRKILELGDGPLQTDVQDAGIGLRRLAQVGTRVHRTSQMMQV